MFFVYKCTINYPLKFILLQARYVLITFNIVLVILFNRFTNLLLRQL